MLADSTNQARPVGFSGIYQSNLHLKIVFFQVEYLCVYVHILFFSSGNIFYLAVMMLLRLLPTGSHFLMNITKLGLSLSHKYFIYFSIELSLFIYLGVHYR